MLKGMAVEKTWHFVRKLDEAIDERAIEAVLHEIAQRFGLSSMFGGVVPTQMLPRKEVIGRILLQRFPEGWAERYNQRNYVFRDPIVERLKVDDKPFFWSDAYESSAFRGNVTLIRGEASEFGLRNGFVVPISLLDGSTATISFGGEKIDLSPEEQSLLCFVSNYAVGQLLHRRCSANQARGILSAREHECLVWAADGKTDWEISVILRISKPTVVKHMLSARQKLDAVNRAHAIAIALREKVIR